MDKKCNFDRGVRCAILTGFKTCTGCKFFKTKEQFEEDQRLSAISLTERGLVPIFYGDKVSVKKVVKPRTELKNDG